MFTCVLRRCVTFTLLILFEGADSVRVPGEIKRSRDLRGGRWSWTLNLAKKRS